MAAFRQQGQKACLRFLYFSRQFVERLLHNDRDTPFFGSVCFGHGDEWC
jgi:hypothetical protein